MSYAYGMKNDRRPDLHAMAQAALDAKVHAEQLHGVLLTAARMEDEGQQIPAPVIGTIEEALRSAGGALAVLGDIRRVPQFAHAWRKA